MIRLITPRVGLSAALVVAWGAVLVAPGAAKTFKSSDPKSDTKPPAHMSTEQRVDLIRGLQSEFVLVRRTFPMGEKGLVIKNGKVSPDEATIRQAVALRGLAARPGDKAQITNLVLREKSIVFEINGGPKHKGHWYNHVTVGMGGNETPVAPGPEGVARGSVVTLEFDKGLPSLTVDDVKKLLGPVFDFSAHSAAELYAKQFPPVVQQALKDHNVLVGMNKELATEAKGRPDQRIHEKDAQGEYEEWIYGVPPQPVEFVRFHGDEVIQVETMKPDGQKIVRTAREVDLKEVMEQQKAAEAAQAGQPGGAPAESASTADQGKEPAKRPTLRRPGEAAPDEPTTITTPQLPRSSNPSQPPVGNPTGPPMQCPNPPCVSPQG